MAFDLDLTTETNDIHFDETGNLALVEGDSLVAQRVRTRLLIHLGEWMLNITIGVDYRGTVFVKSPDLTTLRALFADVILSTPGVDSILELVLSLDQSTRRLFVTAKFASGDTVESIEGEQSLDGVKWYSAD